VPSARISRHSSLPFFTHLRNGAMLLNYFGHSVRIPRCLPAARESASERERESASESLYLCLRMCVYVCACLCVSVCACVCACASVRACVCSHLDMPVSVRQTSYPNSVAKQLTPPICGVLSFYFSLLLAFF